MKSTAITFVVRYTDPDKMNQKDQTRSFPTEHKAREFVHETLDKISPKATGIEIWKLTTERKKIF